MARPREFDEAEVLEHALRVFWERGYDATSVEDLTAATGLGRASLYGAFGDKQGLFDRALAHYMKRAAIPLEQLAEAPSVRAGLRALFEQQIAASCPAKGPRGCFLLLSGVTGEHQRHAERLMHDSMKATELAIQKAITRGRKSGELPQDVSPSEAAHFLAFALQGLSLGARAGRTRHELSSLADFSLRAARVA